MFYGEDFNEKARQALEWTKEQLNSPQYDRTKNYEMWNFLGSLEESRTEGDVLFVHGSPRVPTKVFGYDVDAAKTTAFLDGPASGTRIVGTGTPEELSEALERPRRVLIMVPAGKPVDSVIAHLQPHLEPGVERAQDENALGELHRRRAHPAQPQAHPDAEDADRLRDPA